VRNAPEVQHQLWRGALGHQGVGAGRRSVRCFISSRIFRSVSATTVAFACRSYLHSRFCSCIDCTPRSRCTGKNNQLTRFHTMCVLLSCHQTPQRQGSPLGRRKRSCRHSVFRFWVSGSRFSVSRSHCFSSRKCSRSRLSPGRGKDDDVEQDICRRDRAVGGQVLRLVLIAAERLDSSPASICLRA